MKLLLVLLLAVNVLANEPNLPNLSLWGYQGWHPTNDYNEMNVVDDYNSINPYHAATISLPDFVTANNINTMYLREEAIVSIDGAVIGTVNMSGAGKFQITEGSVINLNAKDYSPCYLYGGAVHHARIIEGAKLFVYGYDFALDNMRLTGIWNNGWSFAIDFVEVPVHIVLIYKKNGVTGDYNNDGIINFRDLGFGDLEYIIRNWLKEIK